MEFDGLTLKPGDEVATIYGPYDVPVIHRFVNVSPEGEVETDDGRRYVRWNNPIEWDDSIGYLCYVDDAVREAIRREELRKVLARRLERWTRLPIPVLEKLVAVFDEVEAKGGD